MYAIIENGGKQYKISKGDVVNLEKIENVNSGEVIQLNSVVFFSDGEKIKIGKPYLNEIIVEAQVLGETKGEKNIIFKKRKREQYQKKTGHRQKYTQVKINEIREV